MGLLDQLGKILGNTAAAGAVPRGGAQGSLVQAVVGMLANGGLDALLRSFQQKGLGNVAGSWVSTGSNLPVSQDQISHALGPDVLGKLARQSGLDAGAVAGQLTQILPGLIDGLTPQGRVPAANDLEAHLGGLLKGLVPK
jgi:uncharacterized protein YidB (DUF937 family)